MLDFPDEYRPTTDEELKRLRKAADGAPASFFVYLLLDRFGGEALNWDNDTITAEFEDLGLKLGREDADRVFAMITALTTDVFITDVTGFVHICNAIGGKAANFEVFDQATMEEIALTLAELKLFDDGPFYFSGEILGYVSAEANLEGMTVFPPALDLLEGTEASNQFGAPDDNVDPAFQQVINYTQAEKANEIQAEVDARMQDLADRLEALKIQAKPEETIRAAFPKIGA